MKIITFKCYKIANKLPLNRIEEFFKMHRSLSWKEYIELDRYHINNILRYDSTSKGVYMFQFGCIAFINFQEHDVHTFLQYLESIVGKFDFNLYTKYNEEHILCVDEQNQCTLWNDAEETVKFESYMPQTVAIVLAKSVELSKIEEEVSELLDSSEGFIDKLTKGTPSLSSRRHARITSRILRFEFDTVDSIRIFDRSINQYECLLNRRVYDLLATHYELVSRFDVIENKIEDLRKIVRRYSEISNKRSSKRRSRLEIFLLSVFPLFDILRHYYHN